MNEARDEESGEGKSGWGYHDRGSGDVVGVGGWRVRRAGVRSGLGLAWGIRPRLVGSEAEVGYSLSSHVKVMLILGQL